MNKYKLCPVCGAKNEPTLFECMSCETDLTRVKITDEVTEKTLAEKAFAQGSELHSPAAQAMVRVCDCGAKNPANARKCTACGEDLSDVTPAPDEEQSEKAPAFMLSSLDGKYAYKLDHPDITVGRQHEMSDYLSTKSYVSRAHARLLTNGGELYVENLSKTNFTYVNNSLVASRTKLTDGDELALGGTDLDGKRQEQAAYFLVRVGSCT